MSPTTPELFANVEISPDTLPQASTVTYTPIHPKYIRVMAVETMLFWFIVLGAGVFAYFLLRSDQRPLWLVIAFVSICVVGLVLHLALLRKAFRMRGYAIRTHDLTTREGLIFTKHATIPYNKVQQVLVSQGPIERLVKLHRVAVENAAVGASTLTIAGLTQEQAEALKQFIIDKMSHHDTAEPDTALDA